jgi:hypothetical protein
MTETRQDGVPVDARPEHGGASQVDADTKSDAAAPPIKRRAGRPRKNPTIEEINARFPIPAPFADDYDNGHGGRLVPPITIVHYVSRETVLVGTRDKTLWTVKIKKIDSTRRGEGVAVRRVTRYFERAMDADAHLRWKGLNDAENRRIVGAPAAPTNGNGANDNGADAADDLKSEPTVKSQPSPKRELVKIAAPAEVIEEAKRLAQMPVGEWRAHFRAAARKLGVKDADFEKLVAEMVKARARDQAANERRRERKTKSKASLFQKLKNMSAQERAAEISLWCGQYEENPEVIWQEFRDYIGTKDADVWDAPLSDEEAGKLIEDILSQIDRLVVMTYGSRRTTNRAVLMSEAARIMLPFWILLTYVSGEICIHAPIVTPFGPAENRGKSTLMYLCSWMTRLEGKPDVIVNPRSGIYRNMAKGRPIFVEEGQKIYEREAVQEIFDASWTYGNMVTRVIGTKSKDFEVFCHKMVCMLAPTNIPKAAWTRHIGFMMLPQLEAEMREVFKNRDDEIFEEIRRKAARWVGDNLARIDIANRNPALPLGWTNRLAANWRTMFAIADLIGGEWPKKLRAAAVMLEPEADDNDPWHTKLLRALRAYIREKQDTIQSR